MSEDAAYFHFIGTLGDDSIVLNLVKRPGVYSGYGPFYSGYYYLDSIQNPIPVYGQVIGSTLTLTEPDNLEEQPAFIQGQLPTDVEFDATWEDPESRTKRSFKVRKPNQTGVRLEPKVLVDSVRLFPDSDSSPVALFSAQWLEAKSANPRLDAFLDEAFCQELVGDSLTRLYGSTEAAVKAYRDQFFNNYLREVGGMVAEGFLDSTDYFSLGYQESVGVDVLYNTDSLLTLGFSFYNFSGGAHGYYTTALQSFDLIERRPITLEDVLPPELQTKLEPHLAEAVRQRYHIGEGTPLTQFLFQDRVAPTSNFGLTGGGLVFNYPPYEIASFAAGEITLFVPFREIPALVRPRFRY